MKTERHFEISKTTAWGACHQLKSIWRIGIRRDMKVQLFRSTVKSLVLYGSESLTISQSLAKNIIRCNSRMLRMALYVQWKQMISNIYLLGSVPKPSVMIADRRMRMAGHIA